MYYFHNFKDKSGYFTFLLGIIQRSKKDLLNEHFWTSLEPDKV